MPLIAAVFAALGPWITRFFMAKAVLMVAGFMGRLGVVLATNEFAMEPLTDMVISKYASLPAGLQCWLGTFGVLKAVSVMLSGLTLIQVKNVFFKKAE